MIRRYGRHLSFPFRVDPDGRTAQVATEEEHVRDELIQLLLTAPGERVFLPDFGGGVRRLVFEPVGESSASVTKAVIAQAISNWLGHRVTLENLSVEVHESTLQVEIAYRLAGSEDTRIMRFQRRGEAG